MTRVGRRTILRRPTAFRLSGAAKAAWTIIMLLVPFIGLLMYYILRPDAQTAG